MSDRPLVRVRAIPRSLSGWIRDRAKKMGASLVRAAYQGKNAVLDGYIVTARRSGKHATVSIVDTPALLAVPGRLINNGVDTVDHCPIIALAAGRDALLAPVLAPPIAETPTHTGTDVRGYVQAGVAPTAFTLACRSRPNANMIPDVGMLYVEPVLATESEFAVNAMAFMSRTDRVVYQIKMYAPFLGIGTYSAGATGWATDRLLAYPAPWSLRLTDSVMSPVMPFAKRVAPPPYDPSSSAATTYNSAQSVWMRAVSGGISGGVHTLFVAAHGVFDMTNDDDRNGARGLWFAKCTIDQTTPAAPVASVVWSATFDMRASGDPRSTPSLFDGRYVVNNVQPAMMCLLNSGMLVAVAASNCERNGYTDDPNVYQMFNTVSVYRLNTTVGALTREVVVGPALSNVDLNLPMQPYDCAYPVGADTDGTTVYAVFFSTDSVRQLGFPPTTNPSITVIRATDTGSVVVLATTTPYRVCYFAGTPTTECVRYIGNDKYLFIGSNQIGLSGQNTTGDMCALVYDAQTNTVTLAGTIDPTVQRSPSLIIGRLDCPAKEQTDALGAITRKATVIVTTGGKAQSTSEPGGEIGKTYISYDSGETWTVVAEYGSAAGVQYCGTQLVPRAIDL